MECTKCEGKTKVVDTRRFAGTQYRKRKCLVCGNIFWTSEEEADPLEIKDLYAYMAAKRSKKDGK